MVTSNDNDNRTNVPQVDLGSFADSENYNVKIESVKREHPSDARNRRFKEMSLFIVALLMVSAIFILCMYVICTHSSNDSEKKWATTIVSGIISALLGYMVGKSS
ncbi:hypothetical protein [Legionella cincinnatiensis]|uniref:Uncharacterized protein n=1 Tax=Legionella cincinnatiensis TaxID=28085 RepID=A0A378IK70_9GAMM|nr:hypothetical protein [Legionella cincinnatiensis]KTC78732.1 hypothetical protein Lcin_3347 [Legionella cincinnatiensis]STX35320.1 Uncharacterised protein [Legionella cincinnatiensis]